MHDAIKEDILSTLSGAALALKGENYDKIKKLSDQTIHNASIYQDEDSVSCAVLLYALSKIVTIKNDEFKNEARVMVDDLVSSLKADDLDKYHALMEEFFNKISQEDSHLKQYIQHIIAASEIKKSSKIYYHGVSLSRSAQIMGISVWELMEYVGKTKIIDEEDDQFSNVKKRIDYARKLFGGESHE